MINTNSQKQEKKQLINLYMLTKVIKVIGTLSFITVYVLTGNKNIKSFVAVCISFYLLYLLAETILFIKIEKNIKEKKTRDE
jgi:ribosomal protein S25